MNSFRNLLFIALLNVLQIILLEANDSIRLKQVVWALYTWISNLSSGA